MPEFGLRITAALLAVAAVAPSSAKAPATPPRIFIASDSTAQDYKPDKYPQSGWGTMLRCAVDPGITIENRAIGGRSTKSFMAEGRLDSIARDIRAGDTLLIQFGHNDATIAKPERYTPIPDYETNLKRFIAVATAAKARAVLLTPVTRRAFENGHVTRSFPTYSDAAKRVAAETRTPIIDLAALSERWIDGVGQENSARYYLHYKGAAGAPGYPNGIDDDTHFSELGARHVADIIATSLSKMKLPIARHVHGGRPALTRTEPAGGPAC
jgi:lysophospholipase L1-like esterase